MVSKHYFDPGGIRVRRRTFELFLLPGVFVSCALSTPGQSRNAQGSSNANHSSPVRASGTRDLRVWRQKLILSSKLLLLSSQTAALKNVIFIYASTGDQ